MNIYEWFLMFIIYSIIGWIVEIFYNAFLQKKIVNRGFLIGPYCPIYGFGAIFITFFLTKYYESPIILFIIAVIICALLEYITSYLMEKIFNARWWDYSDMKYNINGRICLETMIPFGLLGCFIIYISNPLLYNLFNVMSLSLTLVISIVLASIFILDIVFSLQVVTNLRKNITKFMDKDNTEEIKKKVKETLLSKSFLTDRIMNAFPKLKKNINSFINKGLNGVKQKKE